MNDRPAWTFDDFEVDLRAWRLSQGGHPVTVAPEAVVLLAVTE